MATISFITDAEQDSKESVDLELEFEMTMKPVLADCSRQKLRAFHMTLLKYGSNVDERINPKEMAAIFQVC